MNEIALRYIGGGAYIHGVPARDLTATEAAQHGDTIRAEEAATGTRLYEPVKSKPAKIPAQEELSNG